jgi:hypothetical protein
MVKKALNHFILGVRGHGKFKREKSISSSERGSAFEQNYARELACDTARKLSLS